MHSVTSEQLHTHVARTTALLLLLLLLLTHRPGQSLTQL
jgi:hypothetical protein